MLALKKANKKIIKKTVIGINALTKSNDPSTSSLAKTF
jgi:hypothetical protein